MSAVIRRATREDAPAVAAFALELASQHHRYDAERFAELPTLEGAVAFYGSQTERSDAAVLVAELNGEVVGFAYVESDPVNYAALLERGAWFHDLFVADRARGLGLGRRLAEAGARAAAEFGAQKLLLNVAAANSSAKSFFEKAGFRTTMVEMTMNLSEVEGK